MREMWHVVIRSNLGGTMYTVYYYPACNTCKKAIKWLEANQIEVTLKHIVEETPSKSTLKEVYDKSGLTMNKLFNTSGLKYRELGMKDKLKSLSEDEALELLASEGMLIKRPMLLGSDKALVGFKENIWEETIL